MGKKELVRIKTKEKTTKAVTRRLKASKLAVILMMLVLITSLLCACTSSKSETVKVSNDTIPTLYSVVGERKINGTEVGIQNGVSYTSLTYTSGDVTTDDIENYVEALRETGYLVLEDVDISTVPFTIHMGKESSEGGKIILVDITASLGNHAEINYQVGKGEISKYK